MTDMAKLLMFAGGGLFLMGLLLYLGARLPWLGKLPGNLVFQSDNVTVFIPLGAMILVSVVLTVLLNIFARWFH